MRATNRSHAASTPRVVKAVRSHRSRSTLLAHIRRGLRLAQVVLLPPLATKRGIRLAQFPARESRGALPRKLRLDIIQPPSFDRDPQLRCVYGYALRYAASSRLHL